MKKEIFAAALLLIMLALSIINTRAITALCDDINELVKSVGEHAARDDWDGSEAALSKALKLWQDHKDYTHTVLRHTDIETLSDDFYELLEHIYSRDIGAVRGSVELVAEHLDSIKEMEGLRLGSIF